jgi:hypothetical protein
VIDPDNMIMLSATVNLFVPALSMKAIIAIDRGSHGRGALADVHRFDDIVLFRGGSDENIGAADVTDDEGVQPSALSSTIAIEGDRYSDPREARSKL